MRAPGFVVAVDPSRTMRTLLGSDVRQIPKLVCLLLARPQMKLDLAPGCVDSRVEDGR